MEPLEKKFLIQNLPKILPLLKCSTTLLLNLSSKELLTEEDLDVLDSKVLIYYRNESAIAQTAELFKILYTKTGAFGALAEALSEVGATGALKIIQGFAQNCETEKKKSKVSRFSLPPKYLQNYLHNNHNLDNTFVIYSDDPALTCERIYETVPNSDLLSLQTFLVNISSHNNAHLQTSTRINIVNCERDILKVYLEAARLKLKIVLVAHIASEKPKNIRFWADEDILWDELSAICRHEVFVRVQNMTKMSDSECSETCQKLEHAALLQFIKGNSPIIFNETIPPSLKYYIPRQLISRCNISNDIFNSVGPDVFLIEGIEPYQLSYLALDKPTETSSSILTNASSFETKFIVLQSPAHVKEIVRLANALPVHHLSWKESQLTWKFSRGSLSYIQQHINENQLYQTEENFLEYVNSEFHSGQYLCISDTPGMGKSKLLEKLAANLQEQTSENLVSYVVISELVQEVKSIQHTQPQLNNNFAMVTVNAVSNLVCSNELGRQKIKHEKSHLKHLLLDAFDELNTEDINLGYECLQALPTVFPETMFWITTRPHLLVQVEERLHTLGFNIKPFDKKDQISFLTKFWNQEENMSFKKLAEFANKCLDTVTSKLECNEDFAGIPLQCLLIGEVYQSEAELHGKSKTSNIASLPVFRISSLVDLYEELVRQKFEKFFSVHKNSGIDFEKLEQTHMYRSLSLLFPSFAKTLERLNHKLKDLTICSAGIMEPKPSKYKPEPQFIHRTFAEYFVAKLIHQMVGRMDQQTIDFLHNFVLKTISATFKIRNITVTARTFKCNVICYFLDAILTKSTWSVGNSILFFGNMTVSKKQSNIYLACVYANFQNLFSNLGFDNVGAMGGLHTPFLEKCTVVATARSTLKVAMAVYKKYQYEALNLANVKLKSYNLLDISVMCGKFSTVQYLISAGLLHEEASKDTFELLLKNCLEDTMNDSENVIFEKMQILKLLCDKKPLLIYNVIFETGEGNPIFVKNIHTKLALKILLCVSNDIVIKFLHKNVKTYKCTDYHYMLKCLATNNWFSLPDEISQVHDGLPLWCKLLKHIKLNVAFLEFLRNSGFSVLKGWSSLSALEMFVRHKQCASVTDWIHKESGEYLNNQELLKIVLKFRNFSYLAHLIQSQRLRFSTKTEWEDLIFKICNKIQGVAIGSGETRASKNIIKILEVAVSSGASLTVAPSNDTISSQQPYRFLQIVVSAKPFLFEVCTFLVDNSEHPWMANDPDYALVDALVSVTDKHESVSEALKYILSKQVNNNYTHFQHLLTYIAQKFNWGVVKKIHDWHRTINDNGLQNSQSSFNKKYASLILIHLMEQLRESGLIKSTNAQQWLDSGKTIEKNPSTVLQDCIKHPDMDFKEKCELMRLVCREVLHDESGYKCVYQCNSAGSTVRESSQQFTPIFIDNVLTWVFKKRSSADDKQAILEVAKLLVDCGANVNEEDESGNTPLFNICEYWSSIEWCILIAKAGGRLFHPTDNEKHPIIKLIIRQRGTYCQMQSEILKTRAEEIIPHFGTLLCNVIWYNCELEFVRELCEWHTENVETPLNCVTGYLKGIEVTCLHAALRRGNAEILEYIYVTQGCKNVLNASSKPSLVTLYHPTYYESMKNSREKFVNLLKRIFPFEGMRTAENDPELESREYIRDKIAEYWMELGGRVDATDAKGNTLLHHILGDYKEKHLGTVSKLLKSGASVNAQNLDLETPLHKLSIYGYYNHHAEILKLFLDNNADFTTCDLDGNSVLHNYARNTWSGDDFHCVAEWFVKYGFADLFTLPNKDGKKPLQICKEPNYTKRRNKNPPSTLRNNKWLQTVLNPTQFLKLGSHLFSA